MISQSIKCRFLSSEMLDFYCAKKSAASDNFKLTLNMISVLIVTIQRVFYLSL